MYSTIGDQWSRVTFSRSLLLIKYMTCQQFEWLDIFQQKLFLCTAGTFDVTSYAGIFNNLLDQCIQTNCLGVSSDTVEFMRSMNIPVNLLPVRNLITALGRSNLWLKARNQYKSKSAVLCALTQNPAPSV